MFLLFLKKDSQWSNKFKELLVPLVDLANCINVITTDMIKQKSEWYDIIHNETINLPMIIEFDDSENVDDSENIDESNFECYQGVEAFMWLQEQCKRAVEKLYESNPENTETLKYIQCYNELEDLFQKIQNQHAQSTSKQQTAPQQMVPQQQIVTQNDPQQQMVSQQQNAIPNQRKDMIPGNNLILNNNEQVEQKHVGESIRPSKLLGSPMLKPEISYNSSNIIHQSQLMSSHPIDDHISLRKAPTIREEKFKIRNHNQYQNNSGTSLGDTLPSYFNTFQAKPRIRIGKKFDSGSATKLSFTKEQINNFTREMDQERELIKQSLDSNHHVRTKDRSFEKARTDFGVPDI